MKMKKRIGSIVTIAITGLALAPLAAQDQEMDAQMQAVMEANMPGVHHEHLKKLVGDWTYTATFSMPGAPEPMKSEGTMSAEMMLDGRFVRYVYKGDFMGQPFTGIGIDGYDNNKNAYTGIWMDNVGTQTLTYSGSCENGGKVRTMTGTYVDPMMGVEVTDRSVTTFNDDGTVLMVSYRKLPNAAEAKSMELVLTPK